MLANSSLVSLLKTTGASLMPVESVEVVQERGVQRVTPHPAMG